MLLQYPTIAVYKAKTKVDANSLSVMERHAIQLTCTVDAHVMGNPGEIVPMFGDFPVGRTAIIMHHFMLAGSSFGRGARAD